MGHEIKPSVKPRACGWHGGPRTWENRRNFDQVGRLRAHEKDVERERERESGVSEAAAKFAVTRETSQRMPWWMMMDSIPTSYNQRDWQQYSIHALARSLVDAWIFDREDYPRSRAHVSGTSSFAIILIYVFFISISAWVRVGVVHGDGFMREAIDHCRCSVGRGVGRTGGCSGKSSECVPGREILWRWRWGVRTTW